MSTFDTIKTDTKEGQVKCFQNTCSVFTIGDSVGNLDGYPTYSIAMREGGFVNVNYGIVASWTDTPLNETVFDKWGGRFDANNPPKGLLGDVYAK